MIPIDGEVVDGEAMINESSFTGEPLSKHVKKNDTVFAGTLVVFVIYKMKVALVILLR